MAVRELKQGDRGTMQLGTVAQSVSHKAKKRTIQAVVVYQDQHCVCGIRLHLDGVDPSLGRYTSDTVLALNPNAAIEIAKGLLQNLPYQYVAADDELIQIMKEATGMAEREANAVAEAIKRPNQ